MGLQDCVHPRRRVAVSQEKVPSHVLLSWLHPEAPWALHLHQPVSSSVTQYSSASLTLMHEIQSTRVGFLPLSHPFPFSDVLCPLPSLSHCRFWLLFRCPLGPVPWQRCPVLRSSGQQMFLAGRRSWAALLTSEDHTSGLTPHCCRAGRAASLPCVAATLAKDTLLA